MQHGLPPDIHTASNSMFTNSSTFQLPCFLAPMVDCIATGRIVFGGASSLVNTNDLKSLHGHGKTSENRWVSNFVIDRYLELLKQASINVQMENLKIFCKYCAKCHLKANVKLLHKH